MELEEHVPALADVSDTLRVVIKPTNVGIAKVYVGDTRRIEANACSRELPRRPAGVGPHVAPAATGRPPNP